MSDKEAAFIQSMWAAFDRERVPAVALRRTIQVHGRGDYDVLVSRRDLQPAVNTIASVAKETGWAPLFCHRVANHTHLGFWRLTSGPDRAYQSIHIDLQVALGRKGFVYAPSEPFISRRVAGENGELVLHGDAEAVALALHCLLDKREVREEYQEFLESHASPGFDDLAQSVLPRRAADILSQWVRGDFGANDIDMVSKDLRRILRNASPANQIRPALTRLKRSIRYLSPRRGALIAFIGPDGAGKSSLIEAILRRRIDGPFPSVCVYMGKRDVFLPTSALIRFLYRNKQQVVTKSSGADASTQASVFQTLKDVAGLINWILEQGARYLVKIRPVLQQGGVVLADRYAFDLANRPDYSVVHRPLVRGFLLKLFPMPDRTYLLWEDPEVLYQRKAEWPQEHLEKNLTLLRGIIEHVPNARHLRTNKPVEILADSVLAEISRILGER